MTSAQLVPALLLPLVAWRIYRRVRRSIGRQPVHKGRLIGGIVAFSVLSVILTVSMRHFPMALAGFGGGVALGLPLALLGLKLTRFETTPEGRFYTPNTQIGIALSVLFVARFAYRFYTLLAVTAPGDRPPPMSSLNSPLTLLTIGLLAGYYIAFFAGVLIRSNAEAPTGTNVP